MYSTYTYITIHNNIFNISTLFSAWIYVQHLTNTAHAAVRQHQCPCFQLPSATLLHEGTPEELEMCRGNACTGTTVELLYRRHHWDPAGCPVYSGTSLQMTPLGPSWLSCIQWNLSTDDTTGTQLAVLYRKVPLIQR